MSERVFSHADAMGRSPVSKLETVAATEGLMLATGR
jgi:hypothetical protein